MKLNQTVIENTQPKAKPFKLNDGAGLYLYVAPGGGKLWRYDYAFGGKRKTLSIGAYPTVALEDARTYRGAAVVHIIEGRDPAAEKQLAKKTAELAQRQTFGLVAEELLAKMEREGKSAATLKKNRWLLLDLASDLKDRTVKNLSPVECLEVLQKAESRGRLETARRLRSAIGQVMRYAVATNRAAADPTPALRGAIAVPVVKHRPAIITPEGAGGLMLAIEGYESRAIRHGLTLAAYCFPRPGELRLAKWPEVDTRNAVWTIPPERAKMRREHRIPLSPQAVREFKALWRITGTNKDGFCFPSLRPGRPMSENTLNAALRTLGFDGETHVAHGFRAMASSLINEHSDFSPDAIEKALGHIEASAVRRAYHRAEHWNERVALMNWWADYLDRQRHTAWKVRVLS